MSDDIDLDTISQLKELLGAKFPALVETYTSNSAKYIAVIEDGFNSGNAQGIVDAAHPLKSSSGNLGAMGLSRICADIEAEAKQVVQGDKDISVLRDMINLAGEKFQASKSFLQSTL